MRKISAQIGNKKRRNKFRLFCCNKPLFVNQKNYSAFEAPCAFSSFSVAFAFFFAVAFTGFSAFAAVLVVLALAGAFVLAVSAGIGLSIASQQYSGLSKPSANFLRIKSVISLTIQL